MPRSGGGIYSKGSPSAVSGTTIQSAAYNTTIDDLVTDANAARPISAGGTGGVNVADARTNLGVPAIAGDTFTGGVNVTGAVASGSFFGALSAGVSRWTWGRNTTAESGSNAGSNWVVYRFNDAGAFLGTALEINRATGVTNFNTTPTVSGNTVYHAGNINLYRNRIVNGAMLVSQEHGNATVDASTVTTYSVDQWQTALSVTPGGTLRVQRIASLTPEFSPFRLRHTVLVADGTISAGDIYAIQQPIEGVMVADAVFGTTGARQLILRFGVNSSLAGTFGVSIRNSATNRSWVGTFTISAGEVSTDVLRTFIIPGDVAGTWLTDTGVGAFVTICLAAGTTSHAPSAGGYYAANYLTTAAQTNFMGTASAIIDLFDVGLYVDRNFSSFATQYEIKALDEELFNCQRYFQPQLLNARFNAAAGGHSMETPVYLSPPMRVMPAVPTITGGTITNCTSSIVAAGTTMMRFVISSTAAGDAFHVGATANFNARF
jgi:hypothetical protein